MANVTEYELMQTTFGSWFLLHHDAADPERYQLSVLKRWDTRPRWPRVWRRIMRHKKLRAMGYRV